MPNILMTYNTPHVIQNYNLLSIPYWLLFFGAFSLQSGSFLWTTMSTVPLSNVLLDPWFNFKQQALLTITPWIQKYDKIKAKCLLIRCTSQEVLCPGDLFKGTIVKTPSFLELTLAMASVTQVLQVSLPQVYHTGLRGPSFLVLSSSGIQSRHSSILTLKLLTSQYHPLPWIQFLLCVYGLQISLCWLDPFLATFLFDCNFWLFQAP